MTWHKDAITNGELDALREAAQRAWADDTRLERLAGQRSSIGQCYVTSAWLVHRLGGKIGVQDGHFTWLSSDQCYAIDLTGRHQDRVSYSLNEGYEAFELVENERTKRFSKRADRIFDAMLKHGTDLVGDAFPAEEPQATSDRDQFDSYWHDEPSADPSQGQYQFFYGNGQLEVSPNHDHDELAGHIGIDPAQHTGPVAAGHITVTNGTATFEVQTNVNIKALFRIFKDYAKQVGWQWGGLTDIEGEPISDDFAPKRSRLLNWAYADGHLYLGRTSHSDLLALRADGGIFAKGVRMGQLRVSGYRAEVNPIDSSTLPSLFEWAGDNGLTLYAGNDNVYKKIPDLQIENVGINEEPVQDTDQFFDKQPDQRDPAGVYRCPSCERLFPTWDLYQKHRREQEAEGDQVEDGGFPELDMDKPAPFQPHFTPQQPETSASGFTGYGHLVVMPTSLKEACRVDGFSKYASVFEYDTDKGYTHYVAYANGSPVGYASVTDQSHVMMVQSAVKNKGVATALLYKLMRHYPRLTTNTVHDWEARPLQRLGWVNVRGEKWSFDKGQDPSKALEAPVPFIYDVQEDTINVGKAGARTSDIPGRFTPGGIIEGEYEPGGKVFIRSMTSIPYTVRHLIELWYYSHPELEVKSVHLRDDEGKDTRLASLQAMLPAFPAAFEAFCALSREGGQVYAVGGALRDTLMGKVPNDIDLMVTGMPGHKVATVLKTVGYVKETGKDFSILRLKYAGDEVEVALPRRERSTGPLHQDFDVEGDPDMAPEDDLYRRDFTANAMAVNLLTGAFLDPFGGEADIASGTLRTINDVSLSEDPLRVVRALVAHARHGLDPDEATLEQMSMSAHSLEHLSAERIQVELDKLMASPNPASGIRLAHETGVLLHLLPEVESTFGYDQMNPHHAHTLGNHLLQVLERMTRLTDDVDLRYAALLHDIGKPASAWWHPEEKRRKYYLYRPERDLVGEDERGKPITITAGTFVGADHHELGAEMAAHRLNILRFPKDRVARIEAIIKFHMFKPFSTVRSARKFLAKTGMHADDLLTLRVADQDGKGVDALAEGRTPEGIQKQAELIERVRNQGEATNLSQLAVDGRDLMELGIPEGPKIGDTLRQLTAAVIEDPELNTRERLLKLAYARS